MGTWTLWEGQGMTSLVLGASLTDYSTLDLCLSLVSGSWTFFVRSVVWRTVVGKTFGEKRAAAALEAACQVALALSKVPLSHSAKTKIFCWRTL